MNLPSAVETTSDDCAELAAVLDLCVAKTRRNLPDLVANPASWSRDPDGNYPAWDESFLSIHNWTTSFFTGMAALAFQRTGDRWFLEECGELEAMYEEKIGAFARETMHDLGFLYSLYSVALFKLSGERRYRQSGLNAAAVLADRFVAEGAYIRAWGGMDDTDTEYAGLAIIDSLMNMPLLYWASAESGDPRFQEIAIKHTDTTLRHFIRADASVFHAFRFDLETGEPAGGDNYCGHSIESQWARGTAWAMYGFALAFRHTEDRRYLDASVLLTERFLGLLGEDPVPVWDFRLQRGSDPVRDSSAAAIAVCAIQELEALGWATAVMGEYKRALIARLCRADYLDADPACRGILRNGQVGTRQGEARNAYTSWGDYFFMQALAREIGLEVSWW